MCPPPAYIVPKYPSLNRVNIIPVFVVMYLQINWKTNWTNNKRETEGAQCASPAYIVPKYPSLNRVNIFPIFVVMYLQIDINRLHESSLFLTVLLK